MVETLTPEERKMRIKEKLKNMASFPPRIDSDGLRVAVYRRSSPQLVGQVTSYELAEQYYQNYIRSHGWILKGIYSDEGWDNHTARDMLLEDCESGEIDLILIRSVIHISRELKEALEITREFESRSVAVLIVGENILGSAELEQVCSAPKSPPSNNGRRVDQNENGEYIIPRELFRERSKERIEPAK